MAWRRAFGKERESQFKIGRIAATPISIQTIQHQIHAKRAT
jgi:hypothetical protein